MKQNNRSQPCRRLTVAILAGTVLALWLTACATPSRTGGPQIATGPVPDEATGLVALVNPSAQFVVVDFGGQPVPAIGTVLSVYRQETLVGSVRVSEPVRVRFATADIVAGAPQVGDVIR